MAHAERAESLLAFTRRLLGEYGLAARKRLSQNFLIDGNILQVFVEAADLRSDDAVLEIGPGLGSVTRELARRAGQVLAIELDPGFVRLLEDHPPGPPDRVRVVHGDFLDFDLTRVSDFHPGSWKVVGTLPYGLTTPIIERLLVRGELFHRIVLMVQWEFARRIAAKPGSKDYGAFSVFCQFHAEVELLRRVSPGCFYPAPKVSSAILRMRPRRFPSPLADAAGDRSAEREGPEWLFTVVRAAFGQRRKTLANALAAGLGVEKSRIADAARTAGIDPGGRPETLGIEDFIRLAVKLRSNDE